MKKRFSVLFLQDFCCCCVCCLLITSKEISLSGRNDEHSCLEHGLSEITVLRTRENDLWFWFKESFNDFINVGKPSIPQQNSQISLVKGLITQCISEIWHHGYHLSSSLSHQVISRGRLHHHLSHYCRTTLGPFSDMKSVTGYALYSHSYSYHGLDSSWQYRG